MSCICGGSKKPIFEIKFKYSGVNAILMSRKPAVSGLFYENSPSRLKVQIEEAFISKFGPKRMPGEVDERKQKSIFAGIVPHAGYPYSAAGASHFYLELAESKKPDCFLILGTDHTGAGNCLSDQDFETPFGTMKLDTELLAELQRQGIKINNHGHSKEHSIEVQIPLLQFIYYDEEKMPTFVPMIVGDYEGLAEKILNAIHVYETTGKKVCIIVSSDFTHYGFNYGYVPFSSDDAEERLPELDKGAINFILKQDPKKFISYVQDTGATICGFNGIAVLLEMIAKLPKEEKPSVRLLKYYNSGDVVGDYSNAVGYASIIFEK